MVASRVSGAAEATGAFGVEHPPPGCRPPALTHGRPVPGGWAAVGQNSESWAQSASARCPGAATREEYAAYCVSSFSDKVASAGDEA